MYNKIAYFQRVTLTVRYSNLIPFALSQKLVQNITNGGPEHSIYRNKIVNLFMTYLFNCATIALADYLTLDNCSDEDSRRAVIN